MKLDDFITNLINYYYPINDFVKATFTSYLITKKYSERDFDKLYAWLLKNYSRKWKTTPDIEAIESIVKTIDEYSEKYGSKKDALDYGKNSFALIASNEPELKDFNKEIDETFAKLRKKWGKKYE